MKFLIIDENGTASQMNWNSVDEGECEKVANEEQRIFMWKEGNFFEAEVTAENVEDDEGEETDEVEYDLTWNLVP